MIIPILLVNFCEDLQDFVKCRRSSSRRAGCKTCTGKGMAVLNVQETLILSASTIRIVQSAHPAARTMEVLQIAALEYNWHSLALISTLQFSIHGTKQRTSVSIHYMAFIQISGILSLVSTARSSNRVSDVLQSSSTGML